MGLRDLPRSAIGAYIKAARLPLDTTRKLLGRREGGAADRTVDRADAAARGVAGGLLGDQKLSQQASRKSRAADERARAEELRDASRAESAQAEQEASQREEQAEQARQRASEQADEQREQAAERRDKGKQAAQRSAQQREQAVDEQAARRQEQLDEEGKRARLAQLEREDEALAERQEAVVATDAAQTLGDAAAQTKAARKRKP